MVVLIFLHHNAIRMLYVWIKYVYLHHLQATIYYMQVIYFQFKNENLSHSVFQIYFIITEKVIAHQIIHKYNCKPTPFKYVTLKIISISIISV